MPKKFVNGIFCISMLLILRSYTVAQPNVEISTSDILHFWEAYDSLATSKDSVETFQRLYIERATPGFRDFIKVRAFSAQQYIKVIRRYPKFWTSIRPHTMKIIAREQEMKAIFEKFQNQYPKFRPPRICFAIGCLRTGGTTTAGQVLIGSEIASADSTVDRSEMKGWISTIIGNTGDVVSMVAHEIAHTQQDMSFAYFVQSLRSRLLAQSIREGAADFVSMKITGTTINQPVYSYGEAHFQELFTEFNQCHRSNDLSAWLYNGNNSKNRPADLGYYIGYKICEGYYNSSTDKHKALQEIVRSKNPRRLYKKSGLSKVGL